MENNAAGEPGRLAILGEHLPQYLAQSEILAAGPARTAVIAIHWHRALTTGESILTRAFTQQREAVLARMTGLLRAARDAGGSVIYVRVCNPDQTVTNNPIYWLAAQTGRLRCGSEDCEILPELAPEASDVVLDHHRMSAFTGSDLDIILRSRGIETLVVAGVATNIAVESTARDAADRGYRVVVVADCCVAATTAAHEAALNSLALIVTRIVPASAVGAAFARQAAAAQPATR
jgi:nicotinamidase-related amidase